MTGKKYDTNKLQWNLMDFTFLDEMVDIMTFGANKYGANNWQGLDNAEARYFAAAMRHLSTYHQGDDVDRESGISHLAHAAVNIMFLAYFQRKNIWTQDMRPADEGPTPPLNYKFLEGEGHD
jgi:hypothetical protein